MTAVFPMASDTHPAARRAALTLYAAAEVDRQWLMAQLPGEFRPELEMMLAELAQLGLPRDASLVRSVLEEGAAATQPSLTSIDLAALAALLEHEPPPLAAQVAGLLAPAESAELLDLLSQRLRRQLDELPRVASDPQSALSRSLLAELTRRLPQRQPAPLWRRTWARLRRARRRA